jgi:hypothetical protein
MCGLWNKAMTFTLHIYYCITLFMCATLFSEQRNTFSALPFGSRACRASGFVCLHHSVLPKFAAVLILYSVRFSEVADRLLYLSASVSETSKFIDRQISIRRHHVTACIPGRRILASRRISDANLHGASQVKNSWY